MADAVSESSNSTPSKRAPAMREKLFKDIIEGCEMAKKAGLVVHLTMIVGYPWETREDALRTFKLAKKLMQSGKADLLQATVLIPYPGTPLWNDAKKEKGFLFPPEQYERYDMREPVLKTKDSEAKEIAEICGKIYTIFLTPKYVLTRFISMKSFSSFFAINSIIFLQIFPFF